MFSVVCFSDGQFFSVVEECPKLGGLFFTDKEVFMMEEERLEFSDVSSTSIPYDLEYLSTLSQRKHYKMKTMEIHTASTALARQATSRPGSALMESARTQDVSIHLDMPRDVV